MSLSRVVSIAVLLGGFFLLPMQTANANHIRGYHPTVGQTYAACCTKSVRVYRSNPYVYEYYPRYRQYYNGYKIYTPPRGLYCQQRCFIGRYSGQVYGCTRRCN